MCERLVAQILTEQQDHIQVQKEESEKLQSVKDDLALMSGLKNDADGQLQIAKAEIQAKITEVNSLQATLDFKT